MNRIQKLVETASVDLQTRIRIALIGGLAVSAWGARTSDTGYRSPGRQRSKSDQKSSSTGRPQKIFEAKRCKVEWRVGEPDDPIPLLLRLTLGSAFTGPEVDMLWAHKHWHQEALQRRIEIKSGKLRVFLLHPEDLILMKLDAGEPQDLLDVQTVLASHPPDLDIERLKRNAARIRVQKLLDNCVREAIEKTRSQ